LERRNAIADDEASKCLRATSGYKSSRYPRDLVDYMRGPGKRKVLFGSNFAMLTVAQCLEDVDQLALSDEARALFLAESRPKTSLLPRVKQHRFDPLMALEYGRPLVAKRRKTFRGVDA